MGDVESAISAMGGPADAEADGPELEVEMPVRSYEAPGIPGRKR